MPVRELQLIERIRRLAAAGARASAPSAVNRGIGDDCAILRPPAGHDLLVTTDFSIEGVHFRRDWHPAQSVGHRCLARGLSDIAAMGGEPFAAFLSLALPAGLPQKWVDGFLEGFLRLAKKNKVTLAGGDVAASPREIAADVIVHGTLPRGQAILRSGARPGDKIYVTGEPGRSAATLALLRSGRHPKAKAREHAAHFFPQPRIAVGRWLREQKIPSAMIDLSDGISSDLGHICDESGVAAIIYPEDLPGAERPRGHDWRRWQFFEPVHGGEDYELLFTAPPRKKVPAKIAGVPATCIGEIVSRRSQAYKMVLLHANGRAEELKRAGYEHFAKNK